MKDFDTQPYPTSKGWTMMRENIGTRRSKGFDVRPIVTCDNTIVMAKRRGSRGFDVWPIVTCDDGIITAWVHGLKHFNTRLIVM